MIRSSSQPVLKTTKEPTVYAEPKRSRPNLVMDPLTEDLDVESHKNFNLINNFRYCGKALIDRIVGGDKAVVNQFPWSALLQYRSTDPFQNRKNFQCGGSLITERYVLTGKASSKLYCYEHY